MDYNVKEMSTNEIQSALCNEKHAYTLRKNAVLLKIEDLQEKVYAVKLEIRDRNRELRIMSNDYLRLIAPLQDGLRERKDARDWKEFHADTEEE